MITKQLLQTVLFFMITSLSSAQELYLEIGKTASSFDYKNSQGERQDNLHASSHQFMFLGYSEHIDSKETLQGSLGVGYTAYGAKGSDGALNGIMEWDVNYLELQAGLDLNIFHIKKTAFYLKGAFSTGFLLQGTQTLDNHIINLKKADDFDKALFSFKSGLGFSHPVSETLSVYVQYLFGKSLNQSGNDDYESLRIRSNNLSFGAAIKL